MSPRPGQHVVDFVNGAEATIVHSASHGLLKRTGVDEIDEQAEAERQHGEFVPYVAAEAAVYSAADRAGTVPELKGLLASRARPEILATVLSRRLRRRVEVQPPNDDVSLPLLRWRAKAFVRRHDGVRRVVALNAYQARTLPPEEPTAPTRANA